ncbi:MULTISPECIES: hypothetical protein [unclassified Xanthobacter]|uniref:hypothetical protein n=1 Tax=unclassified Xanthobacter TaxID=2623496 RepID=UPI001F333BC8|nr:MULTISPECIES: hypothetical protein [unclassified Xanthobacter]
MLAGKHGSFTIEPVVIAGAAAYYMVVDAKGCPVAQGSLSLCMGVLDTPSSDAVPAATVKPILAVPPASAQLTLF